MGGLLGIFVFWFICLVVAMGSKLDSKLSDGAFAMMTVSFIVWLCYLTYVVGSAWGW